MLELKPITDDDMVRIQKGAKRFLTEHEVEILEKSKARHSDVLNKLSNH